MHPDLTNWDLGIVAVYFRAMLVLGALGFFVWFLCDLKRIFKKPVEGKKSLGSGDQ